MKKLCSIILCICMSFSLCSAVFADDTDTNGNTKANLVSDLSKILTANIQDDYSISAALSMIKMLDDLSPDASAGNSGDVSLLGYIDELGFDDAIDNKSYSNIVKDKLKDMYDSIDSYTRGALSEESFLDLIKRGNGNLFGIDADDLLASDDDDIFNISDIAYLFDLLGIDDELTDDAYEYTLFSMLFIMRMIEFYYGESDFNIQPIQILYIMYVISVLYDEGLIDDFDVEKIKSLLSSFNYADISDLDGTTDTSYHYLYPTSVYLQKIKEALLQYGMPANMVDGFISQYGTSLIHYSQDKIRALAEEYVRAHSSDIPGGIDIDAIRQTLISFGLPAELVDAFLQAYGSGLAGFTQEQLIAAIKEFVEKHQQDIPLPDEIISAIIAELSRIGGNIDEFLQYLKTSRDQLISDIISGKETIEGILSKIQGYLEAKQAEQEARRAEIIEYIRSKLAESGIDINAFLSYIGNSLDELAKIIVESGKTYLDTLINDYNAYLAKLKIEEIKADIRQRLNENLQLFLEHIGKTLDQLAEEILNGWAGLEQAISEFFEWLKREPVVPINADDPAGYEPIQL